MATLLAYTSPALGHLYPISALLAELGRRGHVIALRTLRAGVDTGSRLGLRTQPIDARIEAIEMADWTASNPREAIRLACEAFARRAVHEVDDLHAAIAEVRPDALIIDANSWGAASVAEAGGLPWLSFWPYPPFLTSRGVPPFGPGLKPWRGTGGRIRDAMMRPLVTGAFEKAMLGPLNDVRSGAGASRVRSADDFVRRAPLMLVATAEPLEYPHPDWGRSVQLIGPCAVDSPVDDPPGWLDAIERPIVLVSTSSERQQDCELVRSALAALADEPVHVVATMPAGVPGDIVAAANATVREYVPHGAVLDRAVCAVTRWHGSHPESVGARRSGVCRPARPRPIRSCASVSGVRWR